MGHGAGTVVAWLMPLGLGGGLRGIGNCWEIVEGFDGGTEDRPALCVGGEGPEDAIPRACGVDGSRHLVERSTRLW